jgi:hypothetical protein
VCECRGRKFAHKYSTTAEFNAHQIYASPIHLHCLLLIVLLSYSIAFPVHSCLSVPAQRFCVDARYQCCRSIKTTIERYVRQDYPNVLFGELLMNFYILSCGNLHTRRKRRVDNAQPVPVMPGDDANDQQVMAATPARMISRVKAGLGKAMRKLGC